LGWGKYEGVGGWMTKIPLRYCVGLGIGGGGLLKKTFLTPNLALISNALLHIFKIKRKYFANVKIHEKF
jgi:hypothetical protein